MTDQVFMSNKQNNLHIHLKATSQKKNKQTVNLKSDMSFIGSDYDGATADDFNFFGGGFPPDKTT